MLERFMGLGAALFLSSAPVLAGDFVSVLSRDFKVRNNRPLQVTNLRGDVVIEGWSQDRIRVRARRTVQADSQAEADRRASALDIRFGDLAGEMELSAEYGQGLSIEERLRERGLPKANMELVINAPSGLPLHVWTIDGKVKLRRWRASVEVRTQTGAIHAESIEGGTISLLCPKCEINVKDAKSSLRCMGGDGAIQLSGVRGDQVYVESDSGSIHSTNVISEQLYVTKSGAIVGRGLEGSVEFHTGAGAVDLLDVSGFASGKSETGSIRVGAYRWKYLDEALFESVSGDINLSLPAQIHAEVDLWSVRGSVKSDFKVQRLERPGAYGPDPLNRISGRVGIGGEVLKVFSESGNVVLSEHKGSKLK